MALPSGFTVNGVKQDPSKMHVPPMVKKVITALDKLPFKFLMSTMELSIHCGFCSTGSSLNHPVLRDYWEMDGRKKLWGSRKSIAHWRKSNNPEENNGN